MQQVSKMSANNIVRTIVGNRIVVTGQDSEFFGSVLYVHQASLRKDKDSVVVLVLDDDCRPFIELKLGDIALYDESTRYDGTIVYFDGGQDLSWCVDNVNYPSGTEWVVVNNGYCTSTKTVTIRNVGGYHDHVKNIDKLWCYKDDESDERICLSELY